MQEENKTVDIDTSGPDTEIEINSEDQSTESTATEATEEISTESVEADASQETSDNNQETEASTEKKDEKEELENYSKDVQRRIAKLTKKWREAERQKEEALNFAKAAKYEKDQTLRKYSSLESASVKDREARIQAALVAAETKLANAREAGDIQAEVAANKEIARLGYEEARLFEAKAMQEASLKRSETEIPQYYAPKRQEIAEKAPDPKAEEWAAKNKWFGTDTAMTYTAFDLHKKLTEEEGYDTASDEYYEEIDRRIRLEFPNKFANIKDKAEENTTKPTQIVAGAKRSVKPGRKTVRLTPSQVQIAKKLGVPLEDYAKQLKIMKEV
jgi:hypothetical protein